MKTMPFALKSFLVGTLLAFLPIGAQRALLPVNLRSPT